jgi:hypothetical protein
MKLTIFFDAETLSYRKSFAPGSFGLWWWWFSLPVLRFAVEHLMLLHTTGAYELHLYHHNFD